MVWVGVNIQGNTALLIFVYGTSGTESYCNEIIDFYARPYAAVIDSAFISVDNNACPYQTRLTNQYLERETIIRIDLPVRSLDRNWNEHILSRPTTDGYIDWEFHSYACCRCKQQS